MLIYKYRCTRQLVTNDYYLHTYLPEERLMSYKTSSIPLFGIL
jgi:hypothetical protein